MNKRQPSFLWGAATSSHQIEGNNIHNDWWEWEQAGNIEGGVSSGLATDHIKRFKEDLALAKGLGLNTYRFSVEWSRLEPSEGKWDSSAIDWYRDLIDECERLELKPMLTLHHFTLPAWLARKGGLKNDKLISRFLRYAEKVESDLGEKIPLWCTINEPMVLVSGSYLGHFMPPGSLDPEGASKACANLLGAHVAAYDFLKKTPTTRAGFWKNEPRLVGYAHNMIDLGPERRYHPAEQLIAKKLSWLYNDAWIESTMGRAQNFSLPFVFRRAPSVKEAQGRATTDYIGVNYYTRGYVQWRPRAKDEHQLERVPVGLSFSRRKEECSDLQWAIHPSGLGKILRRLKRYGKPILITENGIADRDDTKRPEYLVSHLSEIAAAISDGVDVQGYYHWSLLDNFEWIKGFWPRFGLYSVDYQTFERTPTKTAELYRELIRAHGGGVPQLATLKLAYNRVYGG